jgi:cell division cycle 20-like protein 1 (cofactor of APC complex)
MSIYAFKVQKTSTAWRASLSEEYVASNRPSLTSFSSVLTIFTAEEANRTYSRVLRSELFGNTVPQADSDADTLLNFNTTIHDPTRSHTPPSHIAAALPPASITPSTPHKNLFTYVSPRPGSGQPTPSKTPRSQHGPNLNVRSELYSLSPIRYDSQRILETPRKQPRYVNKVPYKVLDAPDLQDDFYLNLVDWGSSNVLGVGLGNSVYMWNSQSGRVTKLCELKDDTVTSVSWIQRVRKDIPQYLLSSTN